MYEANLSPSKERRGGGSEHACCCRPTLCTVTLGAAQFMDHGQFKRSNAVYQRGRRIEDGRESFPCRKLCFGIIYAMIKMFPLWRKTAGSTNGHLLFQPNMKESLWAAILFFLPYEPSVKCWDFDTVTALSLSSISTSNFWQYLCALWCKG